MDLPATPAGDQARWFIAHCVTAGRDLTVEEVADHMNMGDPAIGRDRFRETEGTNNGRPSTITRIEDSSPHEVAVTLDYGDDRPQRIAFTVEADPPHRIIRLFFSRAIPEDIVIRPAVAADGPALNDLEVRAPMQIGDTTLVYDRGDDFLGFGRLMGNNICFVADRDSQLLGMACGTTHPVRIGGVRYEVMLLHHLRVPVEHRKLGVFSTLNSYVFGAFDDRRQGEYGYTAIDNAQGMRIGGPGTWDVTVYRLLLDTAANAGPPRGRWASPADADQIVDILNRAHDHEEMWLPHSVGTVKERLERAADLYTWPNILVGEGAVLGVWPAGLRVTAERDGTTTQSIRAVVLDHGFVEGAEEEFKALLGAWCARLLELGHTEVMFITSEGSSSLAVMGPLARTTDPYSFRMAVPEPPGTKERGLYVDAIYF